MSTNPEMNPAEKMSPAEKKKRVATQIVRQAKKPVPPPDRSRQPVIVKTTELTRVGAHSYSTSRYVLGYVLGGTKYIWATGDQRVEVRTGDIFFLSKGMHQIQDEPDSKRPFEQILFFYDQDLISNIVGKISVQYEIDTCVTHSCDQCGMKEFAIERGWSSIRNFFALTNKQLRDGYYASDATAESLTLTQLIYMIISQPEGCLRTRVLASTDPEKELMVRLLPDYIAQNISLEEFAAKNNRSLSSFKKKFKQYFNETPHRWVTRQRLMLARLKITSTNNSIAAIGTECHFPNTSHFIKLYRKEFGLTPTQYRHKFSSGY